MDVCSPAYVSINIIRAHSTLTQLMIAHISPYVDHAKETQHILRNAEMARCIVNAPVINLWEDELELDQIALLEQRIHDLESILGDYEDQQAVFVAERRTFDGRLEVFCGHSYWFAQLILFPYMCNQVCSRG